MADTRWRIVNDYDRGRLIHVMTICPTCWETHGQDYPEVTRFQSTKTTTVRTVDAARLSPTGDECYLCSAAPAASTAMEEHA